MLFAEQLTAHGYARVAVERGVDRYPEGLTYGIPADVGPLAPGVRVVVPLGRGNTPTAGYVVEVLPEIDTDPEKLKGVLERDGSAPVLPGELLQLATWISRYYATPIGVTLASMLPAAVKRRIGTVARTLVDLGVPADDAPKPTRKQREVIAALEALDASERPIEIGALRELVGLGTKGPITRLIQHGHLTAVTKSAVEARWSRTSTDDSVPDQLTAPQTRVIDAVGAALGRGFSSHLLLGVTGAGKTEVYIRLIERVLAAGKAAVLLVPEISLTPQTAGRLIGRLADGRVAVLHSGLTAAQRHQGWRSIADGSADLVIGARSAVFAPVPDGRLGLVIVDEEHDGSYKQDQAPRYNGRDVALRRGQIAGAVVLLGSATPSLESWHNATDRGVHALHELPERAPGLRLPPVKIVDMAEERRAAGRTRPPEIGPTLGRALRHTLDGGDQAILLLNRRGYASHITCPSSTCGWVMRCEDCDVSMVMHRQRDIPAGGFLQCHHCRREQRFKVECPDCGSRLIKLGFGTQRVQDELVEWFPDLVEGKTLLRLDSDTMRSAHDFHDALDRFREREVLVLLGTQMIAKGLDFPGVRLVGVINADTALHLPDFRASERTFQLVAQVAGRTGRGTAPGRVIVQTYNPGAPAIELAGRHDYKTFAALELEARRQMSLPPITRMVRIVVRDEHLERATEDAATLAATLARLAPAGVRVLGPAPCPIARISNRFRQQVELHAASPTILQQLLADARAAGHLRLGRTMAVDVDPLALL